MAAVHDQLLIAGALDVQARAYAPYSHFKVGAAVDAGGRVFVGANVENASYGLAVCAERTAIAAAVIAGATAIDTLAVVTRSSPPSAPCGMCRQVMAEFARDPRTMRIIALNPEGETREWTLSQLLPDHFSGSELP
jgi:cytidine deaminase